MKILANKEIKNLFLSLSLVFGVTFLLAEVFLWLSYRRLSLLLLILFLLAGGAVWAVCFVYFNRQNQIMEQAFRDIGKKLGIHNMGDTLAEELPMKPACELFSLGNSNAMEILNRGSRPEDWLEDRFGILSSPYEYNILHFHPGYLDQYLLDNTSLTLPRCRDLATLCDPQVRRWLDEHEVELTNFDALYE
jgi:hypothetical protein